MFTVRGLEIHSSRMWRRQSVDRALEVMSRVGLNALIFHQNDMIDQLVMPEAYFSEQLMWKRWPVRMHSLANNRQYIRTIIRAAAKREIQFFIEIKEIWFHEGILELFPHLRKADGAVCPTDPFWWDFLRAKTEELLQAIPDLAGIIISPASRESKISISTNTCGCDRCRSSEPLSWYTHLFASLYEPLNRDAKKLVVRDFSYTVEQQTLAIEAAAQISPEIVIALKNTPHDFYPTFPNNPRIGRTGEQPQWVEFDTWGQFFGLGFFPCSVVEDMQKRLIYCRDRGVEGVWFRTDWEGMTEASSFNSLNLVNVFGGGMLSNNPDIDLENIYGSWIDYGLMSPLKSESCQTGPYSVGSRDVEPLMAFMRASWSVIEKTVFVCGHVIHEDGMFPNSVQRAFDMMTVIHSREEWEPGASTRLDLNEANLRSIFEEKKQASAEVQKLGAVLKLEQLDLPARIKAELETMLELYVLYVQGFAACTEVCFLTKQVADMGTGDIERAESALQRLRKYRKHLSLQLEQTDYPHYVYWLLDLDRLDQLVDDAARCLSGPGKVNDAGIL